MSNQTKLQIERDELAAQLERVSMAAEALSWDIVEDPSEPCFKNFGKLQNALAATPRQHLAEIKCQAIKSLLDHCQAYSIMNTYAICIEDIVDYAELIHIQGDKE